MKYAKSPTDVSLRIYPHAIGEFGRASCQLTDVVVHMVGGGFHFLTWGTQRGDNSFTWSRGVCAPLSWFWVLGGLGSPAEWGWGAPLNALLCIQGTVLALGSH